MESIRGYGRAGKDAVANPTCTEQSINGTCGWHAQALREHKDETNYGHGKRMLLRSNKWVNGGYGRAIKTELRCEEQKATYRPAHICRTHSRIYVGPSGVETKKTTPKNRPREVLDAATARQNKNSGFGECGDGQVHAAPRKEKHGRSAPLRPVSSSGVAGFHVSPGHTKRTMLSR